MGWEERNGRLYYYSKERQGGRVVSRYVGAGTFAADVATLDELGQLRRKLEQAQRAEERRELEELRAFERTIDSTCEQIGDVLGAAMIAAGYHQHKRQWRKKRSG